MNEMQIFQYENNEIRTVLKDGEPWWVLKDVADILGIENHKDLRKRLDADEVGRFDLPHPQNPEKTIPMACCNESGLYKVILRSDKPEAKKFTRWVTHEVLPAIRKTGQYRVSPKTAAVRRALTTDDYIKAASLVANCRNERLPYVLGFLEQGGFETPVVEERAERMNSAPESYPFAMMLPPQATASEAINWVIRNLGLTPAQIGKMTGLCASCISRYRDDKIKPKPERAELIVRVITEYVERG